MEPDLTCDEHLRARIEQALAGFECRSAPAPDGQRRAAVALTVVDEAHGADLEGLPSFERWQARAALILTRRSAGLRNHPGQWALPGGRVDPGETPDQTARRELHEEVALALPSDTVLGRLDDFVTRSGFVIHPVVVWGGPERRLTANPGEVASIHRIPLVELLRDDAPLLEDREGSDHPVLRMPVGDGSIAAPTAALLYQFREVCLLGRATRVAHYEQPEFAWR